MLLTLDERRRHVGRPMLPLLLQGDPHIYFLTHESSQKVRHVTIDPQVTLTVTEANWYLVLAGRAVVLRDPRLIAALWRPTYRAWFPGGKDDREVAVLRVDVERVDYWEAPRSRLVRVAQAVRALVAHRAIDTPMKTIDGL